MPLLETEIVYKLSGGSVGAGNTDPNLSLGGVETTGTQIVSNTAQNLFDNVNGVEARDGAIEYRCIFVRNASTTFDLQNAVIWFASNTPSGDDAVDMALGDVGVGTSPEQTIGTAYTEPTNPVLSFFRPASSATGLSIGTIPAGQHKGIWFRRTVNAGAASYSANSFSWTVQGQSS